MHAMAPSKFKPSISFKVVDFIANVWLVVKINFRSDGNCEIFIFHSVNYYPKLAQMIFNRLHCIFRMDSAMVSTMKEPFFIYVYLQLSNES